CSARPRKEVQNSNGKRQMANVPGLLRRPLVPSPVGRVKMPPHLPFDLCHLPFDLLVPEKKFKIQMAKGKWQMFRVSCAGRWYLHPSAGLRCPHICHLTFAICHLICSSQKRSSKFKWQKANGKCSGCPAQAVATLTCPPG